MSSSEKPADPRAWPAGQAPATPFSGATIDRAADLRRDPDAISDLLLRVSPNVVCATSTGVMVVEGDQPRLLRLELRDEAAALAIDGEQPILLGLEDGVPLIAVDLDGAEGIDEDRRFMALREAGLVLPQVEGGLAAYAVTLLNWHRRHRFCANCGAPTEIAEAGLSRRCPSCGASHFPRTDPCVIMAVGHEDRILLGRRTGWPEHRYSVLAGFVASGETPEEAVVREVMEESGIVAHSPRYLGAQPWPFPSSLMLGYEASSDGGDPVAEEGEMHDVRWFTRAEVKAARRGESELLLPGEVSIARMLIDRWVTRSSRRVNA